MRTTLLFSLVIFSAFFMPVSPQADKDCSSCSVVEHALKDMQGLKVGMTRKNIESHNFVEAGGMIFRDHTRYDYKSCEYIHLEVDFSLDLSVDKDMSPKDVITGFSKLTLDYPTKD